MIKKAKTMYVSDKKQNSDLTQLQADLELQYGPAVAQDIVDRLRQSGDAAKTPDYMDVKAMSEMQEKFRAQAMMAIWRLKEWRRARRDNVPCQNLIDLEGVFLTRQCADAVKLYRLATKTYHAMYREALDAITHGPAPLPYFLAAQSA